MTLLLSNKLANQKESRLITDIVFITVYVLFSLKIQCYVYLAGQEGAENLDEVGIAEG